MNAENHRAHYLAEAASRGKSINCEALEKMGEVQAFDFGSAEFVKDEVFVHTFMFFGALSKSGWTAAQGNGLITRVKQSVIEPSLFSPFGPGKQDWKADGNYFSAEELRAMEKADDVALAVSPEIVTCVD